MKAYDYEAQRWVTGAEAVRVRRAQLDEELALLGSDRAAEYLRMIGSSATVRESLASVRAQLAELTS